MYKLLLISKYLRRKLAPLFAAVAVTICTAMVIIVTSVMGGFLGLMQTTAKKLTPDVVIETRSLTGFEGYDELIDRLEALDEVDLASPAIVSPSSATFAYGSYRETREAIVHGIDPQAYDNIVPYRETLLWSAEDRIEYEGLDLSPAERERYKALFNIREAGATLRLPEVMRNPSLSAEQQPGAVLGVALNPFQTRDKQGQYSVGQALINQPVTLAMPVFGPDGQPLDVSQPRIKVVNESKSGFYEADSRFVFVPFDWLQKQLKMHRIEEYTDFDPETGLGGEPVIREARCTHVYVKAAEGVSPDQLQAAADRVVARFVEDRPQPVILRVLTWEQKHATLLGAVKNEKGLVTFLFAIISIVAIVMVATTFYMIVLEKTKDIGVLRAIGASSAGVLNLFLAYGLAIGLIGAALGVWLAWFTVTNLNNLQAALANKLGTLIAMVVLSGLAALVFTAVVAFIRRRREFSLVAGVVVFLGVFAALMGVTYYGFPSIYLPGITIEKVMMEGQLVLNPNSNALDTQIGWKMWDPQLYFFEKIPDQVAWDEVVWIAIGAVLSSVIGAVIPAVIAARLNPVEALRYE